MRGFTLIELIVCASILSILAWLSMPVAEMVAKRSRERELRSALVEVRKAIDDYKRLSDSGLIPKKAGASGYPESLVELMKLQPDGKRLLRRVPRDPFNFDRALLAEQTWGLRSFASEHATPAAGADVYDIYTESKERGLNGLPYRQW
jgi:general secretion pathway protein G